MKAFVSKTAFALFATLAFNASATTHFVDAGCTNPVAPYTSWATAATNIQDAVNNFFGSGNIVLVTNGVYQYGGDSFSGSNRVDVSGITVQSVNGPAVTIIKGHQVPGTTNGTGAVRCVYLREFSKLYGFTLTNGATSSSGGDGGGVILESQCVISNCIITGNTAGSVGGGAYSANNSVLINCIITGNIAIGTSWGGGADGCVLVNCLLAGNQSGYRGGAAGGCTLINCTVAGNSGELDTCDDCNLKNCISYYNTSGTIDGTGDSSSYSNCCLPAIPTFNSGNNFTNLPMFANLSAGDFHLSAASPCINAGINAYITNATDLDGNPRVIGGIVDLGAYEFQSPVHYVNLNNTAPVSPFTNWVSAATNIQDAIDVSSAGDFVVVSNGFYNSGLRTVYGAASNRVAITQPVTVQSVNGPVVTAIQGSITTVGVHCVYLTNGAVLSGFTLTNGSAAGAGVFAEYGGGVWCESSSAIVTNCWLIHNSANQYGGGAFRGTLINCLLTNNSANYGGGACSNILINCILVKNAATVLQYGGGGAIYSTLSNCLLVANTASGSRGGGAYFSTLNNCVVSNNFAGSGGGVAFGVIYNTLISSNRASGAGGGAYSNTLNNCVLKNNSASVVGGGASVSTLVNCTIVTNVSPFGTGGGVDSGSLANCIIFHNSAGKVPDFPNNSFCTLNYCDTTTLATNGFGNITNEPAFVDLTGGDFHLQSNSPCINSGNNAYVVNATDFDGNPRIAGGTVDIGAYEFQSPSSTISYVWLQQYGLPTDGSADNLDSDGDGFSNYAEWRAGTNPNDASSLLQMASVAPTNNFSGATITWQSVSGVNYFVQRGSDLSATPIFTTIASNIIGQAGTTSFTDTIATNPVPYFYRVGVQ